MDGQLVADAELHWRANPWLAVATVLVAGVLAGAHFV